MHGIAIPISAVFTALLALMLVAISIRITVLRAGKKINLLDGGDEQLRRAIRVQGNFIEYVPIALILLALTEWSGAQAWLVYCFGAALLVARLVHAFGLYSAVFPARVIGTSATWIIVAAEALVVLGRVA